MTPRTGRLRVPTPAARAAPSQDVLHPPSIDLRAAMALAAPRGRTATGFVGLFTLGLPAPGPRFHCAPKQSTWRPVQRPCLRLLSGFSDSHIVRKHGEAVAHIVMTAAQAQALEVDAGFGVEFFAWD